MAAPELGSWQPMELATAVELFASAPFRWWISGGKALELHLGRTWRQHDDTDVGILRRDASRLRSVLAAWDIAIAAAGTLHPWTGETPHAARHENNLWCRRSADGPWELDVTVGEGDDDTWAYRRDERVRRPWSEAVLTTEEGVPYLAPELQLLFKSKDRRAKDDVDAREVIPHLESTRRGRLGELLPDDHPWQKLVAS